MHFSEFLVVQHVSRQSCRTSKLLVAVFAFIADTYHIKFDAFQGFETLHTSIFCCTVCSVLCAH